MRELTNKINKTDRSILLLGPRQTGKSTLIQSLDPELKIDLALQNEFLRYSSQIDLFTDQIKSSQAKTIFVDEIQRIPELLNSVQAVIDDAKDARSLRFFLTGSSARRLKRGGANLLPGRVFTYYLGGLCARELGYQVDTQRALQFGFMPEPYLTDDAEFRSKFLMDYSQLKNSAYAQDIPIKIEFFRTRHGLEVDFIVTLKGKTWAIQAKAGDISHSDLVGLKGFRDYYPQVDHCVAVSLRGARRITDGILVCDWLTLIQEMGL